jgi:hypothetical protein
MRRRTTLALLATLMLVASACSSDSSEPASSDSPAAETTAADVGTTVGAADDAPDTESADAEDGDTPTATPAAQASGAQTATVTLDSGDVFEFSALCWLETQESAGSEILFTVVSYDDPVNLDVTQFGADSFGGAASISLYDSNSYDTLWEANSLYGTEVELNLDGSTVTGSGDFYPAGDIAATPVAGQLVANC